MTRDHVRTKAVEQVPLVVHHQSKTGSTVESIRSRLHMSYEDTYAHTPHTHTHTHTHTLAFTHALRFRAKPQLVKSNAKTRSVLNRPSLVKQT